MRPYERSILTTIAHPKSAIFFIQRFMAARQRKDVTKHNYWYIFMFAKYFFFFFSHFYFRASGQVVVTGVVPSPPRFLPSIFIVHRVQQSHCTSIFHRVLLTHALALSASEFVHKKKSQRIYTSMYALGGARTHETNLYQARG